jgi:hypothetical protein
MKEYGIKIETFQGAGRFQHKVYEIGVGPDREGELSNKVVDALKKVNEMLWEEMPEGSTGLVSMLYYNPPKKTK